MPPPSSHVDESAHVVLEEKVFWSESKLCNDLVWTKLYIHTIIVYIYIYVYITYNIYIHIPIYIYIIYICNMSIQIDTHTHTHIWSNICVKVKIKKVYQNITWRSPWHPWGKRFQLSKQMDVLLADPQLDGLEALEDRPGPGGMGGWSWPNETAKIDQVNTLCNNNMWYIIISKNCNFTSFRSFIVFFFKT